MQKRKMAIILVMIMLIGLLDGCTSNKGTEETVLVEEVELVIAGGWPDCRALDIAAAKFVEKYPNCTISYEYLQDYNSSLLKRAEGEDPVDMFFTINIQDGSAMLPYALDLNSCEGLDLSNTFEGLIDNFKFRDISDSSSSKLYAIPLGAELRGLYVNKTLLATLGLNVPTDQDSLLEACKVLKENGYTPFHGNPGDFSQTLLYPWFCNLIVNSDNAETIYNSINQRADGNSEIFREPMEFLYKLVENDYYDYKKAQTEIGLFLESSDEYYARYFMNILDDENGNPYKVDDVGQIAFMPSAMSLKSLVEKTKEDYHSEIEYEFILSPIGPDGGYAYMSPAHGIAVCKNSKNQEWAIRFLNFLFQPENNKLFTEAFNVIPNTKEAFSYIKLLFDVPENHISELGQVTFDFGFYDAVVPSMVDMSKANNPKYMQDDGNGNLSLYSLEHFMEQLENSLKQQGE